ncbi:hypothetical protein [Marichromatium bheemlicum]|uniref:Lipoprotein n=1 Tax=Marichromatium bheemlicum TaxID=365339 RepID=A0ABX1I741_9GAMM|nr:hypothetical protein [Marichromatium bheemlicum]NKN32040.1 hypothetical protein [Marichromatium bheemlicum]
MTSHLPHLVLMAALALTLPLIAGCEQEGPAEEAGRKIDQQVEQLGEQLEQAREAATEAVEEAGDRLEQTTDTPR